MIIIGDERLYDLTSSPFSMSLRSSKVFCSPEETRPSTKVSIGGFRRSTSRTVASKGEVLLTDINLN